eukprot:164404-Hanusia_phi.AAC.2
MLARRWPSAGPLDGLRSAEMELGETGTDSLGQRSCELLALPAGWRRLSRRRAGGEMSWHK